MDGSHDPSTADIFFQEDRLQGSFCVDIDGSVDDFIVSTNGSDDILDPVDIETIKKRKQ